MSQPIVNGHIVRIRYVWERNGGHVYVCRTYRIQARPAGSTTLEVAYVADKQMAPVLCSVIGPAWNYQGSWCRRLLPAWDGSPDETVNNGPYATLPIGDTLPSQVCSLLHLFSDVSVSRHHGKMYLPSPTDIESNNGQPTATHLTALAGVCTQLVATHTAIPPGFGNILSIRACVGVGTPSGVRLVTSANPGLHFGTQRRRAMASKSPTSAPFDSTSVS